MRERWFVGTDWSHGGAECGRVHRGSEGLRLDLATGPVVHNDPPAHQEASQRQPGPALSEQDWHTLVNPTLPYLLQNLLRQETFKFKWALNLRNIWELAYINYP